MKRFKSGFSLAEVLLALAIVAIIATLGFTMSRKGIEHAYNQYIYTGYNALSIAIADANANGKYYDTNGGDNQDFYKHIYNLLNDKKELSAASDIPVIANNTLRLPFMGVITGAADNKTNGLISSDVHLDENGMPELEVTWGEDTVGGGGGGQITRCNNCNARLSLGEQHKQDCVYHPNYSETPENGSSVVPAVTCPNCGLSYPEGTSHTCPTSGGGENPDNPDNPGGGTGDVTYRTINAANGIVYTLNEGSMKRFTGHDANHNPTYENVNFLSIAMSVPSPKNKNNATEGYNLMYIPNSGYPLIPYSGQELAKIADRIDILSYVIDDGETGRVGPDGSYKPLKRYTFKEAVCHYNPKGYRVKPNSIDVSIMTGGAYTTCEENCMTDTNNSTPSALAACLALCGSSENHEVIDQIEDPGQFGDENENINENEYVDLFGCPVGIERVQGALQLVGPRR